MKGSAGKRARRKASGMRTGGFRLWHAALASALAVLLALSFTVYLTRLSAVDQESGGGTGGGERVAQMNLELPPPGNVKVVVERGSTVTWEAVDDIRVIGYNIYRFKGEGDPGEKINAAIVSDTVYHDDEGTVFNSYAVAAVDREGKEGPPSAPVAAAEKPRSLPGLAATQEPERITDTTLKDRPRPAELPVTVVDCTADGMSYEGSWYLERYPEVTGGTIMVTPYQGDSVTYVFSGSSVAVISTRHWNYGIMEIFIDGELRGEVDLYSSELRPRERVFSATGLGPGAHNIRLVCTGRKNPSAFFTFVGLEALEVR